MNQSLHSNDRSQRVKMMVARAIFGGALSVACAAITLADEPLETTIDRPPAKRLAPSMLDTSVPMVRLRLPLPPIDSLSTSVNLPARWADLSSPNAHHELTAIADADNRSGFEFDRPRSASLNVSTSVHVGPAPSAFVPESFLGGRQLSAQQTPQALRPSRLPPTGYFDESITNNRIAAGPRDSRLPLNVQNK